MPILRCVAFISTSKRARVFGRLPYQRARDLHLVELRRERSAGRVGYPDTIECDARARGQDLQPDS